ncbi:MAG: AAA family ATPase [Lachnospiraceae bacterium]|nr:AAA family ATPase [Lachnospiraceae bacterium]
MKIKIQTSQDSFRDLRESGSYYIDKTEVIREYLEESFEKAVMFTRPRRFGKSLTMTMFRDFLDIRQDSKDIFDGLKIMNYPNLVKQYMNQYPVVFLSLKEVFGQDFETISENFSLTISNMLKPFEDILEASEINEPDKVIFRKLEYQEANREDTIAALALITSMLHDYYKKPVFVIIDEYDAPMSKAYGTPFYDKVREMIGHMLSFICKTNSNVKSVMLSGCLYTIKNSAYTGVNNIVTYTVLSPLYASAIGFTDENVRMLLADAGLANLYDTVVEWYGGYIFGRERMYCPWDVLSFVKSKQTGSYSEAMGPKGYWLNASETSLNLIHGFLGKTTAANERFEQLLAGNTIVCSVNEYVPYHRIHESGENLWSALVETGYLTKTVTEKMPLMPLKIPNESIKMVFRQEVWNYFNDKVDNVYVRDFVNALWTGEIQTAEAALNQILEATLSFYHEYHEYSYHLILDGFFTGLGYRVQSERETGNGRSDLIIPDPARQRCLLIELKHVKKESEIGVALKEAESLIIIKKKYESELLYEGYTTRIQYAMAFCDKCVLIARAY